MALIDDFKANLIGGGARANQFRVTITPPSGIAIGLDVRRASFLVRASNLPAQTLAEIAIPFRGRQIYIAGDREFTDPWSVTFLNVTDFMIRNAMERWSNGINDLADGTGVIAPSDYQTDLLVEQLDRSGDTLKKYTFRGSYPQDMSPIDLNYGTNDEIERFTVTFAYQYYETDTTT